MGIFNKIFGKQNNETKEKIDIPKPEISKDGNSIILGDKATISFSGSSLGSNSGSQYKDFYVYEWYIEDTGEVFYVGKGRGDRYKEYHERAYEAEKIRTKYRTGVKFVATGLSEEDALNIESTEMTRILNETNDRLTNRITPLFAKRDNGYSRSPSAPLYQFETAPVLYASEIDEHYFDIQHRPFDKVEIEKLTRPSFIDKSLSTEELSIIYDNNYEKYYKDVVSLLEKNGSKIIKSKYAKSVTAWIYPCDDYVTNYEIDETLAEERIGKRIPVYHLIDVWKCLKTYFGDTKIEKSEPIETNPNNNRVPLSQIKNLHDMDKGFDDGYDYWEKGEAERKAGNINNAIELFDKARYNGYFAPALYKSYAMSYRKLKDLDNEIAILEEAIDRYRSEEEDYSQIIVNFEEQKRKAIEKLNK